jgi:hypothetical protein
MSKVSRSSRHRCVCFAVPGKKEKKKQEEKRAYQSVCKKMYKQINQSYLLIGCDLSTQREDTRETTYLTSKVTKVLDISSKNGWISNIRLCL